MKPKKAGKILKAQDKRFAALGGATLSGWLESPDRVALVLAASPGGSEGGEGPLWGPRKKRAGISGSALAVEIRVVDLPVERQLDAAVCQVVADRAGIPCEQQASPPPRGGAGFTGRCRY